MHMRVGYYVRVIDKINMGNIVDNLVKFYRNENSNQAHSGCQEFISKYYDSIKSDLDVGK